MKAVMGRTIFSRILVINVISVLACISVLGSTAAILINRYISRQSEEALGKNAESIVSLIKSNVDRGTLENILNGFSRSSHAYIFMIDKKGSVLIHAGDREHISQIPAFISDDYTRAVLSGEKNSMMGNMGGIFSEVMFTLQEPIITNNQILGAVLISIPVPEKQRMTKEVFRILLFSACGVLLVSFLLSYMLAKRFSKPIHTIRDGVKEFQKGNLSARVGESATASEITEIAALAQSFNEMAYELEKVEEIRRNFISDVSHELRTPMTTISGFVYGMLDETIPPEKQKEYLQIVYDEITRLSRLVNTFLDISRMRSDAIEPKKTNFNINEIIRLTVIGLQSRLQEKNIHAELNFDSEDSYVFADRDSIKRVMTNLLDNAVKFTDEGGRITITVKPRQHEVFVMVYNTGCGIPEEQQKMIFERLYKVDQSRSINREGTGIGLYLVKSIINAHGKTITVRSVEGEFAEFTFSLDKGKSRGKRE